MTKRTACFSFLPIGLGIFLLGFHGNPAGNPPANLAVKTMQFMAADLATTLQMDVYSQILPAESAAHAFERPLFVFLHGGGFYAGSRDHPLNVEFCEQIAGHGIDVASIDYRLLQRDQGFHCGISTAAKRAAIEAAAEDLTQAISVLRPYYPSNIFIGGSSAGAHAALHAAYHMKSIDAEGVISMCGAMEPLANAPETPLLAFHGTCDALVPYGEAMHHYCRRDAPGALLLQGGGAAAECLPHTQLHAYLNAGHELTNLLLGDTACSRTCAQFIQDCLSTEDIRGTTVYASAQECALPSPFLPCQH